MENRLEVSANRVRSREERVGLSLMPYGGLRAMTGIDFNVIAERDDFIHQRIHQLLA
jgi:hypothetical protein